MPQRWPQTPQLATSFIVSAQAPLQQVAPPAQGRVALHANVGADGTVQAVTAGDNQGVAGGVVACMIDVLKGAKLPAPGRPTTLDVPVSFQGP